MDRRRYKNLMLAPGSVRVTGGGSFCKALLQISFLIVLFLLLPLRAAALPEGKFITVTKDTAICWADSDSCFNYILQGNQLLKATGKKLRAGGTYFHTPFDVTKQPDGDAMLSQLLAQERRSFGALLTWDNLLHSASYVLLLAILWLAGLWLFHRVKRRYRRQLF